MPHLRASESGKSDDGRRLRESSITVELIWNLPEPIWVATATGELLDANRAFLNLVGAPSLDDLRQVDRSALWSDPGRYAEAFERLTQHGALRDFELALRCLDGSERTVLCSGYVAQPQATSNLVVAVLVDITRRKLLERELQQQAVRDALTGCYNRRYLETLIAKMRPADVVGAIVADIDHFKRYNDQYGHAAGDEALVKLARFLTSRMRPTDVVVRMGGDEFLILLFGSDTRYLTDIAVRFQLTAPQSAPVPFTLGWALREQGEHLDRTIARADEQLIHVRVQERRYSVVRRSASYGAVDTH